MLDNILLSLTKRQSPLEIPSRDSTAVSIRHSISNQAYATSISWDHGNEVCFLRHRELESFSNEVPRSDCIISGPAMFYTSTPIRRARRKIAGTMETSILSRLSRIPLQVLLLYASRGIPSVSTIKASDNIHS